LKRCWRLERPFLAGAKDGFAHLRAIAGEGFIELLDAALLSGRERLKSQECDLNPPI
jgi:hypothetical protein